jgi:tetratricopeptide (TPR) repeat protein
VESYGRADVLRILHITPRQLAQWQKVGLVPAAEQYSFSDLLQMKKVRDLRDERVRPGAIRQSMQAMQRQVAGIENPLLEAGVFSAGSRVLFRHHGQVLEPIAGQFVLDFSPAEQRTIAAHVEAPEAEETANELFARGVMLEDEPENHAQAMTVYAKVLEMEPGHSAAHINLGTLYYNQQDYRLAEWHYRKAIEADPRYALAHFDLGNVLDETGRIEEAVESYRAALLLVPTYADAHYNLALAFEKLRQFRRALVHWRAYLRLDKSGPWSVHAKNQVQRILENDQLQVVFRRDKQPAR